METYREFLDRIHSFEKKVLWLGDGYFHINPSVSQKVDFSNHFKPFYGDTIVFNLDSAVKEKLAGIVDAIYGAAPECFCERIGADTFHMTLHDLSNSPVLESIAAEAFENELRVIEKARQINAQKIKMRSTCIFNMVNTSLVLGLCPVDEAEYEKLMRLYSLFDAVKPLPYPLTPHITLGYYSFYGFDAPAARRLENGVNALNEQDMEIELDTRWLYYQKFVNMNRFIDIFPLTGTD